MTHRILHRLLHAALLLRRMHLNDLMDGTGDLLVVIRIHMQGSDQLLRAASELGKNHRRLRQLVLVTLDHGELEWD
jgi:hypothetical protein